jgi:hypothetical protein
MLKLGMRVIYDQTTRVIVFLIEVEVVTIFFYNFIKFDIKRCPYCIRIHILRIIHI